MLAGSDQTAALPRTSAPPSREQLASRFRVPPPAPQYTPLAPPRIAGARFAERLRGTHPENCPANWAAFERHPATRVAQSLIPQRVFDHQPAAKYVSPTKPRTASRRPLENAPANEAPNKRAAHAPQEIVGIGAPSLLSVLRPAVFDVSPLKIPMATAKLRKECLCEGKDGWCEAALRLVQKVAVQREECDRLDTLLTDARVARADRIKSAANLAPFLPARFVRLALGMSESRFDAESAEVIMYQLMCEILPKWSNSTLAGVASFWYRFHWFLMKRGIPHSNMFDGDITLLFTRNVEITAGEAATRNFHKRSRQLDFNPASADSTRVNNGTAAGPGVRKAMAFLNLHFGMLFPIDVAIMKCTRKK